MMKMPTSANLVAFGFLAALAPQTAVAGSVVASPHRSLKVDAIRTSFLAAANQSKFNPLADDPHFYGDKQCGVTTQVNSASNKYERCPKECPYYAQNLDDDLHCSFVCVEGSMCAELNPKRPIPDVIAGKYTCRGPMVEHCSEFNYDGTDTCARCQTFYAVDENGHCNYQHWAALISVILLCFAGGLFGFIWLCDLIMRPINNQAELTEAQNFRTRQKLHTPKDHNGKRDMYPLETNLCTELVAGPGMLLHFNFQVVLMVWAFWVATWWVIFASVIDNALFVLGTRKFGTPRENCILVAWGYETQQRLMWTKVWFLIIMYTSSFFMSMLHGVRQLRLFQGLDAKTKTMKDFVLFITDIPITPGSDKDLEKKLAKTIHDYTKQDVVGVSVCWNWKEQEDTCMQALMANNKEREDRHKAKKEAEKRAKGEEVPEKQDPEETEARVVASYGAMRKFFHNNEKKVAEAEDEEPLPEDMSQWIQEKIESTEDAFVVFNTEEERDEALKRFEETGGLTYEGANLQLHMVTCEPDTVQWINFGHSTIAQRIMRLIMGFGYMCLGLLFWSLVFYAPYAWAVMSFNYDNGAQPPFIFAMTFTMVVVMGNAIMYEICARVSDFVGFKYRDDRESCYLILYVIACMFNVLLDFVVTFLIAWEIMKGLGFRTYHGQKLEEVEHFTDRVETYAMQRMLAENTFAYSFPATFLIPFLIEPFITIYFPLKAGEFLVRTHPMITGRTAEEWLMAFEMDMGRYADLLLNCLLGIIIFFFPGGYTYTLFYAMVFSHIVIYAFDHWRVISTIPSCVYASMDVDWWAQWMFAPCIATMVSALVMKANCQGYGYCIKGAALVEAEVGGWFLHVIIHTIALKYLVPLFGIAEDPDNDPNKGKKYKDVAEELACSWFSANPVHCLRSQYVQEDKPHCCFWISGKEHLQEVNPDIHCYFQDDEAEAEDFSKADLGLKAASQRFSAKLFKKKEEPAPPAEAEQDK